MNWFPFMCFTLVKGVNNLFTPKIFKRNRNRNRVKIFKRNRNRSRNRGKKYRLHISDNYR